MRYRAILFDLDGVLVDSLGRVPRPPARPGWTASASERRSTVAKSS
jgi:phosphoglycolate phosphatase-like HAD superfamily hydrolase